MLPPKVRDFMEKVVSKTDAGELTWTFTYDRDAITTKTDQFEMTVRHRRATAQVPGGYLVFYRSSMDPEEFRFFASYEAEQDCALLQQVFDGVQACSAHFPF
ncbi:MULTISPECIES: hypothetical protein [Stenotrophomonas]|uniref:Uncharacterized protein n=1 Tax=Stenotrophomonas aracearum TaxID=3003272 RepID=A0ABY9YJ47_9GAMM|nr:MULTISPECIES: hypothetical protein [unclassified Stenotrophomonas]WNH50309.1 hypothetical protein PDM28_08475 [Stenotrophomonas sp. A5588]